MCQWPKSQLYRLRSCFVSPAFLSIIPFFAAGWVVVMGWSYIVVVRCWKVHRHRRFRRFQVEAVENLCNASLQEIDATRSES